MRPQRLAPMLALLAVLAVPLAAAAGAGGNGKGDEPPPAPVGSAPDCRTPTETVAPQTIVGVWNCAVLEEVRASKPLRNGPPIVARALAVVHTCMSDAWAAYDRQAAGTTDPRGTRRRPRLDAVLEGQGYHVDEAESTDATTPAGIGRIRGHRLR